MADTTAIPRDVNAVPMIGTYVTVAGGLSGAVNSGTAIQLTATPTSCKRVDVIYGEASTGSIYVGGSGVLAASKNGAFLLSPGSSVTIPVNDVSNVWFDSTQTGDKVSYIYYV